MPMNKITACTCISHVSTWKMNQTIDSIVKGKVLLCQPYSAAVERGFSVVNTFKQSQYSVYWRTMQKCCSIIANVIK